MQLMFENRFQPCTKLVLHKIEIGRKYSKVILCHSKILEPTTLLNISLEQIGSSMPKLLNATPIHLGNVM